MRLAARVLPVLLLVAAGVPAAAGELAGVVMPDTIQVDGKTLVLNGMGLREATILKVDVYVAGLYLEAKSSDADAILRASQVKRLVMTFVRAVGRKDLVKAWDESFRETAGAAFDSVRDRVATLDSWMADVPKGTVLTFTSRPGEGVTVEIQDTAKGRIPGEDFSATLFGLWLGPSPPSAAIKSGLLGKRD